MDIQELPGVDLRHNFLEFPWPLPDECVVAALASHVLEHIPKVALEGARLRWPLIEFMNELWRVMKPDAQFLIAVPHGASPGFMQDPTHASQINEMTFHYFDPLAADGLFYSFYRPKPWKIKVDERGEPLLFFDPSGNLEIVLIKRREEVRHE
jgi:SAM-dependent methyltransferase